MGNIIHYDELIPEVVSLYETGLPTGDSTGWKSLDNNYTVAMNQWTLVTGTPHAGKSEWLDALMVNLCDQANWKFAIFSPENHPLALHAAKILEKFTGKPFGAGPNERMTPEQRDAGLNWMRHKFFFMRFSEPSLEGVLAQVREMGSAGTTYKLGVVVDPWNTLEHHRPKDLTLTEYVSHQLSWIINFTRTNYAHFWLVAHPKKPEKGMNGTPPTPYDISDSAHFYNKADNIITVHRDQGNFNSQKVEIHVQKVRFKHVGKIGLVALMYDKVSGRYFEPRIDHRIAHFYDRESA